ncbi:MAG: hypothetical protein M1434_00650 [Chloroflexi bacterium]|nr:hypothetical protein [Chloroflexota bacterium]MCL5273242.1 hypothetical protein [Chloroflexota bacterium]
MPRLSRWLIRASMLYLVVGFTLGGLILAAKGDAVDARVWVWLLPHVDILVVGWLIQLAMGMSYWILPRIRNAGRGPTPLAALAMALLNVGLCAGAGSALLPYWFPDLTWTTAAFVAGVLLQTVSLALFVVYAWSRVLPTITASDLAQRGKR